jgi:hypothetical protein
MLRRYNKATALGALRAELDTQAYKDRETALSMQRVELEAEAGSVDRYPPHASAIFV